MPIVAILVGILVVAGVGYTLLTNSEPEVATETQNPAETNLPTNKEDTANHVESATEASYQDGEYTATAQYLTPTRVPHDVTVSLTLQNGEVTKVETLFNGNREYDTNQQEQFDQEYKGAVVGVELDDISLSRTGGASLTTRAFNEALEEIKDQASTS